MSQAFQKTSAHWARVDAFFEAQIFLKIIEQECGKEKYQVLARRKTSYGTDINLCLIHEVNLPKYIYIWTSS